MKILKEINLTEDQFDEKFDIVTYNEEDEEDGLQADCTTREEAIAFATALAKDSSQWYRHIWTTIDGDEDDIYLLNGMVRFDRISYYFTKQPWGEDVSQAENEETMITVDWFIKADWV